jgi:hypothetical protein
MRLDGPPSPPIGWPAEAGIVVDARSDGPVVSVAGAAHLPLIGEIVPSAPPRPSTSARLPEDRAHQLHCKPDHEDEYVNELKSDIPDRHLLDRRVDRGRLPERGSLTSMSTGGDFMTSQPTLGPRQPKIRQPRGLSTGSTAHARMCRG